jgi:hypothetical protein
MTTEWKAGEHGPIEKLEDNLWTVAAALPGMALRRRMTLIRLSSGEVVVHSAVALSEPAMRDIEAWGTLAFIIVPNGYHRIDAPRFKARYPNAKVLCPKDSSARVAEVVAVDGSFEALPSDPSLRCTPVAGAKGGEHFFFVTSTGGKVSLIVNDAIFNHPHVGGFGGLVMRLLGSTGGPKVTRIARMMMVSDRAALRAQLVELTKTPGLARIVVSHVDIIDQDPAGVLLRVAGTL